MTRELRQTVTVEPEGRFEIPKSDLTPGTTAEIVILFPDLDAEEAERNETFRQECLEKAWAISDKAIAEGMETWDIDRINAEIHERRYGDREMY